MPRPAPNSALWATRVLWFATTVLVAFAITSATRGRAQIAENVALVAWWIVAAAVVIALVVCGPIGLTATRMMVPASVAVCVAALAFGADALPGVSALVVAFLATMGALTAETGEATVQVSAYGDERRMPLRIPAAMHVPIVIAWLLWCALPLGGVIALAARRLPLGIALLVFALGLTWMLSTRLHRFSCRWLVAVPAGVVVHDPVVLGETLMVLRVNIDRAGLALASTEAADLTGPAAGHAVEIAMHEMVQVLFAPTTKNPKGTAIHAQSVLVAPSRPGRALQALAERKIDTASG